MQCSNKIFFSPLIEVKKQKKIIKKLNKDKIIQGLTYLIIIQTSKNLIELVSDQEIKRCINRGQTLIVVGVAQSNRDAKELVKEIIHTIYSRTHDLKVKDYF